MRPKDVQLALRQIFFLGSEKAVNEAFEHFIRKVAKIGDVRVALYSCDFVNLVQLNPRILDKVGTPGRQKKKTPGFNASRSPWAILGLRCSLYGESYPTMLGLIEKYEILFAGRPVMILEFVVMVDSGLCWQLQNPESLVHFSYFVLTLFCFLNREVRFHINREKIINFRARAFFLDGSMPGLIR